MANTIQMNSGQAFTVLGNEGSRFAQKHTALSIITPVKGQADGQVQSASHQLVFDLKESSTFTMNGCAIKLIVPQGLDHARFKLNYNAGETADKDTLTVSRDTHDGYDVKREIFKTVELEQGKPVDLEIDRRKTSRTDADEKFENTQATALEYLDYKQYKASTQQLSSAVSSIDYEPSAQLVPHLAPTGSLSNSTAVVNLNVQDFISSPLQSLMAVARNIVDRLKASKPENNEVAPERSDLFKSGDLLKKLIMDNLSYARSWNDVTAVADIIASMHGKPTNTQDIDNYASKIFTAANAEAFREKGLDIEGVGEKLQVLGRLALLGEAGNPAEIISSGKQFSFDEKKQYIFPIQQHAEEALSHVKFNGSDELVDAFATKNKLGTAIAVLRDIAGMDAPRAFRKNKEEGGVIVCDDSGRFLPDQLIRCVQENVQKKNLDIDVTNLMLDIFKNLKDTNQI